MTQNKSIAIVGGGYTGLVAAYRLAKAGHKVSIFERGPRVGGLASGFTINGAPLEIAYHHLFKTDRDIIDFTKELGINDLLEWHESSVAMYYGNKLYPFMTPMDLVRFTALPFLDRVRAGVVLLYLQKTNNWEQFKHVSAYQWMSKMSGPRVTKVIWEPLLRGKFDRYYDKVAMAWLWARLHIRANSRDKGDAKEKLGYFNGGFDAFTKALTKQLTDMGVEINTGAAIEHVTGGEGKQPGLVLGGQEQTFDSVLCTTPSGIFGHLVKGNPGVEDAYVEKLQSIDYLGAALLIFTSDQEISPYYWHNINDVDLPFLVFIHHTKLIDKATYGGKHVYYIGAYLPHDHELFTTEEQQLKDTWYTALSKIFPDFDRSKIDEEHVFRLKNAQHIVDTAYEQKIPDYKTPLDGVFLANFSQIYPEDRGTNYAVREGNKIAQLVQEYLDKQ
jgi:protoporphyrinogen oxidase